MDQLLEFVREVIPNICTEQLNMLQNKFEESGVTDVQSIKFLKTDDLIDVLKLVPARKLIQQAEKYYLVNTDHGHREHSPEIPQSNYSVHCNTSASDSDVGAPDTDLFWSDKFDIPWKLFPQAFVDACENKQRPSEDIRRAAVRTLSYSIQQLCKKPSSTDIDKIASKMVSTYPEALGDIVMGKMLDSGYCSLKKNLLDRMHNLNRSSLDTSSTSSENDVVSTTVPSSKQYGCLVTWSEDLDAEQEQQMNKKMDYMKNESSKTSTCDSVIEEYMRDSYPLQRKLINNQSSDDVSNNFPFLFKLKYLEIHFQRLTGHSLESYIKADKKKLAVIHYLRREKPPPALRTALIEMDNRVKETNHHFKLVAFIKLILLYFKEDSLLEYFQPCVNTKQVEEVKRKHGAPIIAVIGDLYSPLFFHVVLEGKIRTTVNSIDDAVMVLFGLYYVFNLEYHPKATQTLEFIQRVLIGINPERGTKKPKKCIKNGHISSKVVLLANHVDSSDM